MYIKRILAALLSGALLALSACVSDDAAEHAAATNSAAGAQFSTADTTIGTLLDDPEARAILDRHIPQLTQNPGSAMVRGSTLRAIQGYGLSVLTDEKLALIDADLALLAPRAVVAGSQTRIVNVDEARVPPYVLPEVLTLSNGQRVRDAETWWTQRRPEILSLYESTVFGRAPGRPAAERFDVFEGGTPAFGGRAIRKQVDIYVSNDPDAPRIHLVEYIPAAARGPAPMFLMIHFTTPALAFDDPGIRPGTMWDPVTGHRVTASATQGMGPIDITRFLDAGIGVALYYYGDVEPDFVGGYAHGVRALYGTEADLAADEWGGLAAWAWSMSRVQDYFETDPAVDARRVAIFGASRLGKTVLWAGARDQRFAAVIACCSGKLGAALMRRDFGEPINGTNGGTSAYWTAGALARYYNTESALPVDSHMLLALIAPRPVLLQTGRYDHAADPHGEFLAEVAAGPVYRMLGAQDLGTTDWPPSAPILNDLGYHMNSGGHGMQPGDWDVYVEFLRRHLQQER